MEYLDGTEYVVDSVSRDGVHRICAIWEYDKRSVNGANFVYFGMELRPATAKVSLSGGGGILEGVRGHKKKQLAPNLAFLVPLFSDVVVVFLSPPFPVAHSFRDVCLAFSRSSLPPFLARPASFERNSLAVLVHKPRNKHCSGGPSAPKPSSFSRPPRG